MCGALNVRGAIWRAQFPWQQVWGLGWKTVMPDQLSGHLESEEHLGGKGWRTGWGYKNLGQLEEENWKSWCWRTRILKFVWKCKCEKMRTRRYLENANYLSCLINTFLTVFVHLSATCGSRCVLKGRKTLPITWPWRSLSWETSCTFKGTGGRLKKHLDILNWSFFSFA